MNKKESKQRSKLPPYLNAALRVGEKRDETGFPKFPKIELDLLVRTTLAMQTSPIDPTLDAKAVREIYKNTAHEAILLIEGCKQILSARAAQQAILDKEAAEKEQERLPRTVSFAKGIYEIVGDSNPGPARGCEKLAKFLSVLYGEYLFGTDELPPCEEWVVQRIAFWRKNQFNAKEVGDLRERRNAYIRSGYLDGEPCHEKIVEERACLALADQKAKISDKSVRKSDSAKVRSRQKG